MFWSKKEDKKKLPDLPLPRIPANPHIIHPPEDNEEAEHHLLPSFPDSPIDKGFSQTAIKDAVNSEKKEENKFDSFDFNKRGGTKVIEMDDFDNSGDNDGELIGGGASEPRKNRDFSYLSRRAEPRGDVFVKLSKFNSAKTALRDIENKLNDIENMIKKIKEIKMREEQELNVWDSEIVQAKNKVKEVSENIFEKID